MLTVRYERAAEEACNDAQEKWERADEVINALEWNLAREPKAGRPLSESGAVRAYIIQGARTIGWPTVTAIYTIEGEEIVAINELIFEEAGTYRPGYA